tara:strand:+ start:1051 stop:1506 length:456 start_codon:yes stop_codon:yes gene_type:complete
MNLNEITIIVKEELGKILEAIDHPGPTFRVGEKPPRLPVQQISIDHLVAIMRALPNEDVNAVMELADNKGLFTDILEAFAEPGSERAQRGAMYRQYDPKDPFSALKSPKYPAKIYDFEEKPTVEQVVSMIADLRPHQRKELIIKLDKQGIY